MSIPDQPADLELQRLFWGDSEERFRRFFDLGLIGIAITSPTKGCLDVNDEICRILGYERDELLRKTWSEMTRPDDLAADVAQFDRVMAGEIDGYTMDKRWIRKDGRAIDTTISVKCVRRDDGSVDYFVALLQDITERKRAEAALRASEERLAEAQQLAHIGSWNWDLTSGAFDWSDEHYRIFGLKPQQPPITLDRIWDRVHPDDRTRIEDLFAQAIRDHQPYECIFRLVHEDGAVRTVQSRGRVAVDEDGKPVRVFGTIQDITKHTQAEEAVHVANEQLDLAIRGSNIGIWDLDLAPGGDYRRDPVRFVNVWEQLGYDPAEFPTDATASRALGHPDDLPRVDAAVAACLAGESEEIRVENRIRHKDGSYRWLLTLGRAVRDASGSPVRLIGTVQDVTERKRAEEALRKSEERLAADLAAMKRLQTVSTRLVRDGDAPPPLLEIVDAAIAISGADMGDVQLLDRASGALRIEASRGLGTPFIEFFDAVHDGQAACGAAMERGERVVIEDVAASPVFAGTPALDVVLAAGVRAVQSTPLLDHSGRLVGMLSTHYRDPQRPADRDLHILDLLARQAADWIERTQADEVLRESEGRFRGTFENAAVGIAHKDADGRFLRVNQKYCEIVGYTYDELHARSFHDITHPEDLAAQVGQYAALWRGELANYELEKRYVRRDGAVIWSHLTVSLQCDNAGRPAYAIVILQDISERRQLEADYQRAKEAAEAANRAKGEFLANVSHEIRTPFGAILGMTELVLDTPLTDEQRQCLEMARSAAESLLGLVDALLDFEKIEAGKLELEAAGFSLGTVVGDALRALAARAHQKGLELAFDVHPRVPDTLVGDAGRLRQVLLNLVGNAVKFTERGEVLVSISTEEAGDSGQPASLLLRFGVTDTGIGIPPEGRDRIFRAFEQADASTTRKHGGSGLGLTIAARLVALMGGALALESEVGRGSTFVFTARFGRPPHPPISTADRPPAVLYNLPVLVVDDNATARQILDGWLRGWGMAPTCVGDAATALDALIHGAAGGHPFALVLLDARMPGADALELASVIRERAELSGIRIVLLTSGDRPEDPTRLAGLSLDARLLKPVPPAELLDAIDRVMGRPSGILPPTLIPAVPAPPMIPLQILVAEDDEFNARHLDRLLGKAGHRVRLATNGREALTRLGIGGPESGVRAGSDFDLLLLDLHMPEFDGFQVTRAIREREQAEGGHLPVIALTARSRREDRERCLQTGMDDFLSKPVKAAELFAAIRRTVPTGPDGRSTRANAASRSGLLDPAALLAACGDDPGGLRGLCEDFQTYAPARLAEVGAALQNGDAPRLREAAHKLCGLLSAFSTRAGALTLELEDRAATNRLDEVGPLLGLLEATIQDLMAQADHLTIKALRDRVAAKG